MKRPDEELCYADALTDAMKAIDDSWLNVSE